MESYFFTQFDVMSKSFEFTFIKIWLYLGLRFLATTSNWSTNMHGAPMLIKQIFYLGKRNIYLLNYYSCYDKPNITLNIVQHAP